MRRLSGTLRPTTVPVFGLSLTGREGRLWRAAISGGALAVDHATAQRDASPYRDSVCSDCRWLVGRAVPAMSDGALAVDHARLSGTLRPTTVSGVWIVVDW